ncbi:MAG: GAF domain-containing sensor histidine kinase [Candidatus Sumerlaeota bacterium]|nr:GAF domain-containing sensor histidine kinase [Candidatus Sumerlaeota bacterium]
MSTDPRIEKYCQATQAMANGEFGCELPADAGDDIGKLGECIANLGKALENKFRETEILARVTAQINAGLTLDDVLNMVYDSFREIIPYDRMGCALLEDDGQTARARWERSNAAEIKLAKGYAANINGSSLRKILNTGQPRIINDLAAHLAAHPNSESTRLIVEEGIRSSLTCPLNAMGKPVGFLFFSSMRVNAYEHAHVRTFLSIADQLSIIIEKGRMFQELVELDNIKNRFLGMAVHDLRNPLNIVSGYLSLLLDGLLGDVPEGQRDYLKRCRKACQTMAALLEDLLDINAIESGRLDLEPKEHDLAEFLKETHSANKLLAQAKSIDLELHADDALPRVVMDARRITQVLNNLISNAIKFSYPGSVIRIAARPAKDRVEISVEDQGQGIPEDELAHIFTEFGRGSVKPTGGEKSTGLGLAIVRRIVKAHGGHVGVESEPGRGSTFTITLLMDGPPSGSGVQLA